MIKTVEGYVLYNKVINSFVGIHHGVPFLTDNILDAHLYSTEEEAQCHIDRDAENWHPLFTKLTATTED